MAGVGSLTDASLQTVNSYHERRPIQNFDETVEEAFMIVGPWLEVFLRMRWASLTAQQPDPGRSLIETPRNITGNSIKASHNLFRVCADAILTAACCRSRECLR